jgi:hypothetical protein
MKYFSGFSCVDDLVRWFRGWFRDLDSQGFFCAVREVSDVYIVRSYSGRQVLFVMGNSEIVRIEPLVVFLASSGARRLMLEVENLSSV